MRISRSLMVAFAALVGVIAPAQSIYGGNAKEAGVTFRSWGGGSVRETDDLAPETPNVLRVLTRNFYQGGLIRLSRPANLASQFSSKDNVLRFTIKFSTTAAATTKPNNQRGGGSPNRGGGDAGGDGDSDGRVAGGGLPPTGGPGGLPPSGMPPGGFPPGVPPFAGNVPPPGFGAPTARPGTPASDPPAYLRVVVTTSDGKKSEAYIDVPLNQSKSGNWFAAAVPLQGLCGFGNTNKEVISVLVTADRPTTVYIRDIGVTTDETPIYADLNPATDLNLAFGDEYTFSVSAYAGASQLRYEWNFDAEHNPGIDAEGRVVKRRFRKAGEFTVQVTVYDLYNLKKPFKKSIHVTVNP